MANNLNTCEFCGGRISGLGQKHIRHRIEDIETELKSLKIETDAIFESLQEKLRVFNNELIPLFSSSTECHCK